MDRHILLVHLPAKTKEKVWVQIKLDGDKNTGTYDECINKANMEYAASDWMIVKPVREHMEG